jgi:hypothetical protein
MQKLSYLIYLPLLRPTDAAASPFDQAHRRPLASAVVRSSDALTCQRFNSMLGVQLLVQTVTNVRATYIESSSRYSCK